MPLVLKFPIKRAKPEKSLINVLNKYNQREFGFFGIWYAQVIIGKENKWLNKIDRAKIDSGASISLFPEKYATELNLDPGIPYQFYGVNRSDDCLIDVNLRQVDLKIYDFTFQEILLKNIWIAFSKHETSPILLGVKDVLEKMKFGFNKKDNSITLELIKHID